MNEELRKFIEDIIDTDRYSLRYRNETFGGEVGGTLNSWKAEEIVKFVNRKYTHDSRVGKDSVNALDFIQFVASEGDISDREVQYLYKMLELAKGREEE